MKCPASAKGAGAADARARAVAGAGRVGVDPFSAEAGRLVDDAIEKADRGDVATDAEVRAVFAKSRRPGK